MTHKYNPVSAMEYPRFCGPATFFRLPHVKTVENVDFVIAGVPFDTGAVFRVGARFAPQSIRQSSITFRDYNPEQDVFIFPKLSGTDYGDFPVVPGYLDKSFKRIEKELTPIFEAGVIPILVGGDHSITFVHLKSCFEKYGPVALVHFDSHTDAWDEYFGTKYNHATQFRRVVDEGLITVQNSIQVGLRGSIHSPQDYNDIKKLGYDYITTSNIKNIGLDKTADLIKKRINGKRVFLSFDMDFLDPAYAPGVGFPECGGFTSFEALQLLRKLKGIDFIGFDVVEVLPSHDLSNITSLLASTIIYEFMSLIAIGVRH